MVFASDVFHLFCVHQIFDLVLVIFLLREPSLQGEWWLQDDMSLGACTTSRNDTMTLTLFVMRLLNKPTSFLRTQGMRQLQPLELQMGCMSRPNKSGTPGSRCRSLSRGQRSPSKGPAVETSAKRPPHGMGYPFDLC
mmetsp:Transcript_44955/g.105080  ORF Transcript_44955/g.105080 Transcript_44955/m.105080 type:complete len:137 (-) Transcript_44955:429-839(-)